MNGDPDQAHSSLDDRYRRLVRRARLKSLPGLCVMAGAIYLPVAKGSTRIAPAGEHSWGEGLMKTAIWLFFWTIAWSLPFGRAVEPSGYAALSRAERDRIDAAIKDARPPADPLILRVADGRARLMKRRGEPGWAYVAGFVAAAIVILALAAHVWVAALWSAVLIIAVVKVWMMRGQATLAERYLTAPRRLVRGERVAELFKDAPSIDAAAFRRDMDELADQEPFPRG